MQSLYFICRNNRSRRMVGSGRIASHNDDYRNLRDGNRPPRDLGTRETLRENARMSMEREGRANYNRRDSERGGDGSNRDYGRPNRGYDRRNYNMRGGGSYNEDEPEWFNNGPTSQDDHIELRGFEPTSHEGSPRDEPEKKKQG